MSGASPPKDISGVPYQAYQSKRHSRTPSKPKSYFIPNVSPPLNSRPASTSLSLESQKQRPSSSANSQSKPDPASSMLETTKENNISTGDAHGQSRTITEDTSASTSALPSEGSSLVASTPVRKVSTFRRVAPRNPRTSLPASPLGLGPVSMPSPVILTSQRSSPMDSITPQIAELNGTQSHTTPSVSAVHAGYSQILSLPLDNKDSLKPTFAPPKDLPPTPASMSRPSSFNGMQSASRIPASPTPVEFSVSHSSTTSHSRSSAPYRPGFQPHGTRVDLTDDFLKFRRAKQENNGVARVERSKLERRLDKLIALHFPTIDHEDHNVSGRRPNSVVHAKDNRRASSFFDFDNLKHMSIYDASDLWRGIVGGGLVDNAKLDLRDAEQRITPWQDDAMVTKCPLCRVSFHPITNRKHHCRLCGQIVCSLPPKRPQRSESCSLLFVVDSKSRQIEEVGEGVDYGVRKRKMSKSSNGPAAEPAQEDGEKFLKGVRICRECRPVLLRKHYEQEKLHRPIFLRLHQAFLNLETEIEESLPQFQELILSLSHHDQPSKDASTARKRILEAFSRYDALSKQIRQLPCPNGAGSSQDRVQMAITTRANLFLQKNMFPLKSLPMSKSAETRNTTPIKGQESRSDPDTNLALRLQPLLEQEALLESFVEEAKAHRKFEDVKTLKVNLLEIRQEIRRICGD